jgi:hypothetical protein
LLLWTCLGKANHRPDPSGAPKPVTFVRRTPDNADFVGVQTHLSPGRRDRPRNSRNYRCHRRGRFNSRRRPAPSRSTCQASWLANRRSPRPRKPFRCRRAGRQMPRYSQCKGWLGSPSKHHHWRAAHSSVRLQCLCGHVPLKRDPFKWTRSNVRRGWQVYRKTEFRAPGSRRKGPTTGILAALTIMWCGV